MPTWTSMLMTKGKRSQIQNEGRDARLSFCFLLPSGPKEGVVLYRQKQFLMPVTVMRLSWSVKHVCE